MMAAFTPGPWQPSFQDGEVHIVSPTHGLICVLEAWMYDKPKAERGWDDARLIAAAPDLYEACQEMVDGADPDFTLAEFRAVLGKMEAAIAKAEAKEGSA